MIPYGLRDGTRHKFANVPEFSDSSVVSSEGQYAVWRRRDSAEYVDADVITWEGGPVLSIPPGLSLVAWEHIARAYHRGKVDGEVIGRADVGAQIRELIGVRD